MSQAALERSMTTMHRFFSSLIAYVLNREETARPGQVVVHANDLECSGGISTGGLERWPPSVTPAGVRSICPKLHKVSVRCVQRGVEELCLAWVGSSGLHAVQAYRVWCGQGCSS